MSKYIKIVITLIGVMLFLSCSNENDSNKKIDSIDVYYENYRAYTRAPITKDNIVKYNHKNFNIDNAEKIEQIKKILFKSEDEIKDNLELYIRLRIDLKYNSKIIKTFVYDMENTKIMLEKLNGVVNIDETKDF